MKILKTYESYLKKDTQVKIKELILRFLYFHPGKNSISIVENFISMKLKDEYTNSLFKKAVENLVSHKKIKKIEEKSTEYLELVKSTILGYEIEEMGLTEGKKEKKKKKDICEICEKCEGTYRINPYLEDIKGEKKWEYICDNCNQTLCDDI